MNPRDFYQELLERIDDETERKVFEALASHLGQPITRRELVQEVFGLHCDHADLSQCPHDRICRKCIERLRLRRFPIVASSGEAGYTLVADENRIDSYIAEEVDRANHIRNKIDMLRQARPVSVSLRHWKEGHLQAVQTTMF